MTSTVAFLLFVIIVTAGCIAGYLDTGRALGYGIVWLVLVAAGLHWYARRKNILWFSER